MSLTLKFKMLFKLTLSVGFEFIFYILYFGFILSFSRVPSLMIYISLYSTSDCILVLSHGHAF